VGEMGHTVHQQAACADLGHERVHHAADVAELVEEDLGRSADNAQAVI
jgi:hypothetical protein